MGIDWRKDWLPHGPECKAFVYLAEATISGQRKLKIGKTWNVPIRIQRLRREKRVEITPLAWIPCKNEYESDRLEFILHSRHRAPFSRGEWHKYSDSIIKEFFALDGVVKC